VRLEGCILDELQVYERLHQAVEDFDFSNLEDIEIPAHDMQPEASDDHPYVRKELGVEGEGRDTGFIGVLSDPAVSATLATCRDRGNLKPLVWPLSAGWRYAALPRSRLGRYGHLGHPEGCMRQHRGPSMAIAECCRSRGHKAS